MAIIWAFIYSNLFGNSIGLNICGMWVDSKASEVHRKIGIGFYFLELVGNLTPICGMWD
jgi:hypothetical protein